MAKISNAGQTCIAVDYVLCHESKVDAFIEKAREVITQQYQNMRDMSICGKVVNEFHYKRLCALTADHGGQVVIGNPNASKDMYLQPTVILNPRKDAGCLKEEIFGPILPVITYKNFDEAINYIRSEQEKPLAVYFYGDRGNANMERAMKMTSSGAFVCNEAILQVTSTFLPFGGVGHSGSGRYHGQAGFDEFSNLKSVLLRPTLDFAPFNTMNPPYSDSQKKTIIDNLGTMQMTQATICQRLSICCSLIVLIILTIVLWGPISGLVVDTPAAGQ